jgi:hypothetical protein
MLEANQTSQVSKYAKISPNINLGNFVFKHVAVFYRHCLTLHVA